MPNTLGEMDKVDLINIGRLAYILKGLSPLSPEHELNLSRMKT